MGLKGSAQRPTQQGLMDMEMDALYQLPDHASITYHIQGQEIHTVITPTGAFQFAPGMGSRDLPPSLHQDVLKGLKRDIVNVTQHAADPKYIFAAAGTEKVGDIQAAVLAIDADGSVVRWYIDPKSGQILRSVATVSTPSGRAQRVTEFAEWKPFAGLTLPTKRTNTEDGEPSCGDTIEQWTINPPIPTATFEKPTN